MLYSYENWLLGQLFLEIWNPNGLHWILNPKKRRAAQLFYRTRGIVLHDRALNERCNKYY